VHIGAADGMLTIIWEESGGPHVSPPEHASYGLRIIQTAIVREFDGKVDVSFPGTGLRCQITAPLENVTA
jgi:two-component sensor histidine kinase